MLLKVTTGYYRLLHVTTGYFRLQQITTGYYKQTYQADKWKQIKQFIHLPGVLLRRIPYLCYLTHCVVCSYIRRTLKYSLHLRPKFWVFQKSPKSLQAHLLLIFTSRAFQPCIPHRVKEMPWLINLNNIAENCLKID